MSWVPEDELGQALSDALDRLEREEHPPVAIAAPGAAERQAAAAVLFVLAARADGRLAPDEQRVLGPALRRALGLSAPQVEALVSRAQAAAGARPLWLACLRLVGWPLDDRKKVVHGLWRVVLADAELAGHEEYVVRKTAELLGLSFADLVETKLRAREEFLAEEL